MASDNDNDERWGDYLVNDSDDEEEEEAPLSVEAKRRQDEERKTWAPQRPKSKPRNPNAVLWSKTRKERRQRQRFALQPPSAEISSSLSSSSTTIEKKHRSESPVLVDDDEDESSSSSSSSSSNNDEDEDEEEKKEEEEEKKDGGDDNGRIGGDPIYLVYDDITAGSLMPTTALQHNRYVKAVNKWVDAYQGRDIEAMNVIPEDISPHDTVVRRVECIPLSQLHTDDMLDSYPHLAVPLRTIFVGFVFYDSRTKEAILDSRSMKSIQRLPLKIVPNLGIEDVLQLFSTIFVTLVLGPEPILRTKAFKEVAKQMPPAERFVDRPDKFLSMWDRYNTFFFTVDRPMPEESDDFRKHLAGWYSGGLFGEDAAHAPALLQHMIQLGLLPEQRTKRGHDNVQVDASGSAWSHFLTRGIYDPRLFLIVGEFLFDKPAAKSQRKDILELMNRREEEPFYDSDRDNRFCKIFQLPDDSL